MQQVVDDLIVSYQIEGTGPTVVLLHGWGQNLQTFDQLAHDLATKFRVLRLDLPGFGASEPPHEAWAVEDYATCLQHFLTKLDVAPDVLIGHSFGGRVAIKAVGQGLIQPTKLVLLAPGGIKTSDSLKNQSYKVIAKAGRAATALPGLKKLQPKLKKRLYKTAGSEDYLTAGPLRETYLKVINEDLRPDAERIKVPTLIVTGEEDKEVPSNTGPAFASAIKGSKHIELSAGHFVHVDRPDDIEASVMEFIGD